MKIAQISTCWRRTSPDGLSGVENVVSALTEQLVALGHDVTLYATGDSRTSAALWSRFPTAQKFEGWADEIEHVGAAYRHIAEGGFDVIHNHNFGLSLVSLYLSEVPCLTTIHNTPVQVWTMLQNIVARRHRFVSVSDAQRAFDQKPNWVATVHNGINVEDFPFGGEKDDYLLFVGRMNEAKGAHLAVQAALASGRRLKLAGPLEIPVGQTSSQYFDEQIAPFVDGKTIEYVGEIGFEQKTELYRRAAALLFPIQLDEPFGMVLIEAMACGTPVIAFRRGAAAEIVRHGEVGFLVGSIEEFLQALQSVGQISPEACRRYVEENFGSRLMAERYVKVYEALLESREARGAAPA
ncbi:MAG TPA: glycosyltransferase family 4 protein [Pyrinomonadaceae bacterium]|jgi:glycosyltransferase involved in cell wall biosynthesis